MAHRDNADICAVLSRMVALERFDADAPETAADGAAPIARLPGIGRESLDEFLLDHAHHAERLPRLLDELRPSRAA